MNEFLFALKLSKVKPTEYLSSTEIKEASESFLKKISCGEAGCSWTELEAKANTRVEKWIEQHDELKKASAAKADLQKAIDILTSVYRGLGSADNNGTALSSIVRKRKRG